MTSGLAELLGHIGDEEECSVYSTRVVYVDSTVCSKVISQIGEKVTRSITLTQEQKELTK